MVIQFRVHRGSSESNTFAALPALEMTLVSEPRPGMPIAQHPTAVPARLVLAPSAATLETKTSVAASAERDERRTPRAVHRAEDDTLKNGPSPWTMGKNRAVNYCVNQTIWWHDQRIPRTMNIMNKGLIPEMQGDQTSPTNCIRHYYYDSMLSCNATYTIPTPSKLVSWLVDWWT